MENLPVDHFVTTSAYTPHVYRDQYPAIDPASPALSQQGKVVIITGASTGIGACGLAPAFAQAGAKAVVLVARSKDKLATVAAELQHQHPTVDFLPLVASVDDEAAVAEIFATIGAKHGHADVLVNNAGTWTSGGAPIASADATQWWRDFEVNLKGPFLMSQAFLKLLGPKTRGTIVTMNTGIASMVGPGLSSYSVSRNAALRLVEYIAAEHPNVNAVSLQPGVVATDSVVDAFKRFALDTPALAGGAAVWLSTDAARFLTGRFVSANWSVEDLMRMRAEILAGKDLTVVYQGKFGLDQFDKAPVLD